MDVFHLGKPPGDESRDHRRYRILVSTASSVSQHKRERGGGGENEPDEVDDEMVDDRYETHHQR